jgi:DNA-binding MarR family transcriptional regulator
MIAAESRKPHWTTLETRFAEAEPNLSRTRRRLIREILGHPEDTYFLFCRALANRDDLDPSTIVRTIKLPATSVTENRRQPAPMGS